MSETDMLVGGRILGAFNDRWGYNLRADYSGGGTEGTVNAHAMIGYTFGKTGLFTLSGGYRHMKIELRDESGGSRIDTEITMSGPLLGFIFNF